jgi:hypothetical protein
MIDLVPPGEAAELEALQHLPDAALRTIAREQMLQAAQERMQALMDKTTSAQSPKLSMRN